MNEQEFPRFKFFIIAYSSVAGDYAGLLEVTQEFKRYEKDVAVQELILELSKIKEMQNWREIQEFIIDWAVWKRDLETIKRMVDDMLNILKYQEIEET